MSREAFGKTPQVAVFDTAFHQSIPEKAYLYGVPYDWYTKNGVRRYGFHGTSHRFVAHRYAELRQLPLSELQFITLHLGNGSSAAAISAGKSVDTTMGMTPLEGLIMGTRSGDIDPGLFSYLQSARKMSLDAIHEALNKKSGLLGLSGVSSDLQELEDKLDEPQVSLAIEVLCYRMARQVSAMCTGLDRLDGLIFTGGIGENSAFIRRLCIENLKVLGFKLDDHSNHCHGNFRNGFVQAPGSPDIVVIPTNEELMIALDTAKLIENK
jgi:acetate kinase